MGEIETYSGLQNLLLNLNIDKDVQNVIEYIDKNSLFGCEEVSFSTLKLMSSIVYARSTQKYWINFGKILMNYGDIQIDNSYISDVADQEIKNRLKYIHIYSCSFADDQNEEVLANFVGYFKIYIKFVDEIEKDNVNSLKSIISKEKINLNENYINFDREYYNQFQDGKPIYYSAFKGSFKCFKYFLSVTKNINYDQLLRCAIIGGNFNIIHIVEDEGKRENSLTFDVSLLYLALLYHQNDLIEYIINNYHVAINSECYIKCIYASNYAGFLKLIKIDNSNSINEYGENGSIPVDIAAFEGQIVFMKYLIEVKKVDFKKLNDHGKTILQSAARGNQLECIKYIVENGLIDPHETGNYKYMPIDIAFQYGCEEALKYLELVT